MGTKVSKQQGPQASKKITAITTFNLVKNQAAAKRIAALKLTQGMG